MTADALRVRLSLTQCLPMQTTTHETVAVTSATSYVVERFHGALNGWQAETGRLPLAVAERRARLRRAVRGHEFIYRVAPYVHTFRVAV